MFSTNSYSGYLRSKQNQYNNDLKRLEEIRKIEEKKQEQSKDTFVEIFKKYSKQQEKQ